MMQYKLFCTNNDYLPKKNGVICLWQETTDGHSKLLSSTPVVLHLQRMRNFDDILKDLAGFVSLWDTMANEDLLGKFRGRNKSLSYFERAVMLLYWRINFVMIAQYRKNMQRMLNLLEGGMIVQLRLFKLDVMFLSETSLQCILRIETCILFGSLGQLQTLILLLHLQTLLSCSIGHKHLLNILILTLMPCYTIKKGMCGVRIEDSF